MLSTKRTKRICTYGGREMCNVLVKCGICVPDGLLRVSGAEGKAVGQSAAREYLNWVHTYSRLLVPRDMWLLCIVKDDLLFLQIKQCAFCRHGCGSARRFVHFGSVFFTPLAIVSLAAACVCDFPFEPTVSDAFGPMTHAFCLGSVTVAPS